MSKKIVIHTKSNSDGTFFEVKLDGQSKHNKGCREKGLLSRTIKEVIIDYLMACAEHQKSLGDIEKSQKLENAADYINAMGHPEMGLLFAHKSLYFDINWSDGSPYQISLSSSS